LGNFCKYENWNDCQFVNWSDCYWHSFQDKKDLYVFNQPSRGGDKEKKVTVGAGDYGRKPYMSRSYNEMMRRTPLRATFDQELQKKSQFEKPYLPDEEYEDMQHWAPRFPDIQWDDSGPMGPRPTLPPYSPSDINRRWICSLNCDGRIGRCGNGGCTYAIGTCYAELVGVGSEGKWYVTGSPVKRILTGRNNPKFKKTYGTLDSIEIYPDWDKIAVTEYSMGYEYKWKKATFEVTYKDSDGNVCRGELTVHCCTTCECPTDPAFEYDSGNPSTIARNANATITVGNGCEDFSWSVAGTGFSFVNATTSTRTNTLSADNTACGVGSITVTDNCGSEVTGYIRCTTGSWSAYSNVDQFDCNGYLANTYWIDPVCSGTDNRYKWKCRVYESLSPPAVCPGGSECDGYHGDCWPDVSDGICDYIADAATLGSVYGISRLILYRAEWGC